MPALTAQLGDRSLFPDLQARVYLNHGAVSPPSQAVVRHAQSVLADYGRQGLYAFPQWHEQRTRLRGMLAHLVGARPEDIAFTASTTRGLLDIALCLPWQPGDRVVVFEGEFPANVTPWQRVAALFCLELVMLPLHDYAEADEPGLHRLQRELAKGRVRVVAVSAVQFQTGLRMPVREMAALCHAHGAELCVDAVQAVGAVPLDVQAQGVDYLACGSHKWLMGLEGCGFVYVRPERAAALRPHIAGWLSHDEGSLDFLGRGAGHLRYDRPIRRTPDFLEVGNYNTIGLAGLEGSVGLLAQLGVWAVYGHANRYLDALEPELVDRGFTSLRSADASRRSCILSLRPPPDVDVVELHESLLGQGISCTIPDGLLRLSPHWPNALDEVPVVLAAVDEALAS